MKPTDPGASISPEERITRQIAELGDWRGTLLAQLRDLVHAAVPEITEEWKWDTAVFTHKGMVCAAGVFKDHVKLNFFKGAALADPKGLFNAGLDAKASRGIDFKEGVAFDETALADLIRAASNHNSVGAKK